MDTTNPAIQDVLKRDMFLCEKDVPLTNEWEFQVQDVDFEVIYGTQAPRIYGLLRNGKHVKCTIENMRYPCYLKCYSSWATMHLRALEQCVRSNGEFGKSIIAISMEEHPQFGEYYVTLASFKWMVVWFRSSFAAAQCNRFFRENKVSLPNCGVWSIHAEEGFLDAHTSFLSQTGIRYLDWIRIAKKDILRVCDASFSHADYELWVSVDKISIFKSEEMAPSVTHCYDIECWTSKPEERHFDASKKEDMCVQIGNEFLWTHDPEQGPFRKVLLCVGTCSPIEGVDVFCYKTEKEMLEAWIVLTTEIARPSIQLTYNGFKFDYPAIIERCNVLGMADRISSLGIPVTYPSHEQRSEISGHPPMGGCTPIDVCSCVVQDVSLRLTSYRLGDVGNILLGDTKDDVSYGEIYGTYMTGPKARHKIGVYCMKDVRLTTRIFFERQYFLSYMEISKIQGVLLDGAANRGTTYKSFAQLVQWSHDRNWIVDGIYDPRNRMRGKKCAGKKGYKGGFVMQPQHGFYEEPLAVLDYNSEYPSSMVAWDLCGSTRIQNVSGEKIVALRNHGRTIHVVDLEDEILDEDNERIIKNICNNPSDPIPDNLIFYCTPINRHGKKERCLLGAIESYLMSERKRVKRDMKAYSPGTKEYIVRNARQMALKIVSNAWYGALGASVFARPDISIAASITAKGRQSVQFAARTAVRLYGSEGAFVVGGDTDSIFAYLGTSSREECMKRADLVADAINKSLPSPMHIEVENLYCPSLFLLTKKSYAGTKWLPSPSGPVLATPNSLTVKGLVTTKRDNPPIVQRICTQMLRTLLNSESDQSLYERKKTAMSDVYAELARVANAPIEDFIVTTDFKGESAYVHMGNQPHTRVAQRMKMRDATTAPKAGDRIPWVIIHNPHTSVSERAEHPDYVRTKELVLDLDYYMERLWEAITKLLGEFQDIDCYALFHIPKKHVRAALNSRIATKNFGSRFVGTSSTKTIEPCPLSKIIRPNAPIASRLVRNAQKKEGPSGKTIRQVEACFDRMFGTGIQDSPKEPTAKRLREDVACISEIDESGCEKIDVQETERKRTKI